eukprot:236438_1
MSTSLSILVSWALMPLCLATNTMNGYEAILHFVYTNKLIPSHPNQTFIQFYLSQMQSTWKQHPLEYFCRIVIGIASLIGLFSLILDTFCAYKARRNNR